VGVVGEGVVLGAQRVVAREERGAARVEGFVDCGEVLEGAGERVGYYEVEKLGGEGSEWRGGGSWWCGWGDGRHAVKRVSDGTV
jgi:hypothetical protein